MILPVLLTLLGLPAHQSRFLCTLTPFLLLTTPLALSAARMRTRYSLAMWVCSLISSLATQRLCSWLPR